MLEPGKRLGEYEIVGLLGAGGMGEVYRARDAKGNRDVALKVLREGFDREPSRLRRFQTEAKAIGAIRHPNVLAVYDTGEHDGVPYLVTELLEGATLRARLTSGPLTQEQALEVASHIARGLAAAHAKGIVHRDVKPENIFITSDGAAKLLDFGVARTERPEAMPVTLSATASGALVGTAGYMAPEQVRGRPADARSDVFALGAVLYEMLGGRKAFDGETAVERGYAILNSSPPALPERISPGVERLVRWCLEKSPDARLPTAQSLAQAIDALAANASNRARVGSRRLALAAAGVAVLAGAVWVGWSSASSGRAEPVASLGPAADASVPFVFTPPPGFTRLRIGLVPFQSAEELRAGHAPLMAWLSSQLKVPVELVLGETYDATAGLLERGDVDLVEFSPYSYVRAEKRMKLRPLVMDIADGSPDAAAYIFVRKDSPRRTLEDLNGGSFGFVDVASTSGYLLPMKLFKDRGLVPATAFSRTEFFGNHERLLLAVLEGRVEAGATYQGAFATLKRSKGVDPLSFHIIAMTGRVPRDVVCVRADFPAAVAEALVRAYVGISPRSPAGEAILAPLSTNGFFPARSELYDGVRAAAAALEEGPQ